MAEIQAQRQPRRSFTEEFKRDAVQLATKRGNVSAAARDLGINESVLNRWKRRLEDEAQPCNPSSGSRTFPGRGNARDEELARLQRELARVKEENAILKKASEAIFDGRMGIFTKAPSETRARVGGEIPVH